MIEQLESKPSLNPSSRREPMLAEYIHFRIFEFQNGLCAYLYMYLCQRVLRKERFFCDLQIIFNVIELNGLTFSTKIVSGLTIDISY